jgi:hypothetical protein
MGLLRKTLHAYIPSHFNNPVGLLMRLIGTRNSAAYFAMVTALLGGILTPLDLMLSIFEQRFYRNAPKPKHPLIIVVGAPRTGTTLAEQILINNLPVAFLNNLTSLFPRAPIVANLLFGRFLGQSKPVPYKSYYGKSVGLAGPNDALYIWDRWLGKNRRVIPKVLGVAEEKAMIQFFGTLEQFYQCPIVTKNNNLNSYASVVADVLDNAYFICMTRDPLFLAQSLLKARWDIHGDTNTAYGLHNPSRTGVEDFVEDVCQQVVFHEEKIHEQQRLIGPNRFWIVQYETLCRSPEQLVQRVSTEILGQSVNIEQIRSTIPSFRTRNEAKIQPELFERLKQNLDRMKRHEVE